ncbi:MAG: type II secretion system protein GspD [Nitrospirae bacterium]|nr:type II secretion system protein GspD [Nitrospirota bacterium]
MAEKRQSVLFVVLLLVAIFINAASLAGEFVWKDKPFKYTAHGEDVRDTLKNIAKMSGFDIVFTGTVKGEVTRVFDNVTLQNAFNMLIEEFTLDFEWESDKNFMVVHPKKVDIKQVVALVRLQSMEPEEVKDLLADFNIKLTKFEVHKNIRSVLLRGTSDEVNQAVTFIKELDKASAEELKYEINRKSLKMISAGDVIEVIRLRYATAGSTSLKLGDKTISVPGMDETIKEILGYSKESKTQREKTSSEILNNPVAIADLLAKNETAGKISAQETQQETPTAVLSDIKKTGDSALSGIVMNELLNKPPIISIDQRTNSVIVKGRPEQVEMVKKLISELDKPTPLVELEVMIVSANEGFERSLGLNWNISGAVKKTSFNAGTSQATNPIPSPATAPTSITTVSPSLSYLYSMPLSQIASQITALDSEGLGKILSSPKLITLDNKEANIVSGSSVYVVPTGTFTTSAPTAISTGIVLKVTPHMIIPNDPKDSRRFRLLIHAEKSSFDYSYTTAGNIPGTNTAEINTEVIMDENNTLVLGGLFETNDSTTESGVPLLKDIPLLGNLFKAKNDTKSKKEILFFISPKVVEMSTSDAIAVLEETYKEQKESKFKENIEKAYPLEPPKKKPAAGTPDKTGAYVVKPSRTGVIDMVNPIGDNITITDVLIKDHDSSGDNKTPHASEEIQ